MPQMITHRPTAQHFYATFDALLFSFHAIILCARCRVAADATKRATINDPWRCRRLSPSEHFRHEADARRHFVIDCLRAVRHACREPWRRVRKIYVMLRMSDAPCLHHACLRSERVQCYHGKKSAHNDAENAQRMRRCAAAMAHCCRASACRARSGAQRQTMPHPFTNHDVQDFASKRRLSEWITLLRDRCHMPPASREVYT